jgi:hypothetical protein
MYTAETAKAVFAEGLACGRGALNGVKYVDGQSTLKLSHSATKSKRSIGWGGASF